MFIIQTSLLNCEQTNTHFSVIIVGFVVLDQSALASLAELISPPSLPLQYGYKWGNSFDFANTRLRKPVSLLSWTT